MTVPKIVCPSRGRAGRVITQHAIENLILVVSESQEAAYRKAHPELEIEVHPEELEVPGPLPRTMQWMIERFGDHFTIDDDIKWMLACSRGKGEGNGRMTAEDAYAAVLNTHQMAEELGAYLYGFSLYSDVRNYFGLKPFRFTGMVWNCGMGLRASAPGFRLHYTPEINTHEDYWICLLNMHYHRFMLCNEMFAFMGATFNNTGGAALYRTVEYEKEAYERLREWFGEVVQLKEDKPRAKRKHPYQITLKMPF